MEQVPVILPLEELLALEKDEQKKNLELYRVHFSNKQITTAWNKNENYIYQLMNKLQMKRNEYKPRKRPQTKPKTEPLKVPVEAYIESIPEPVPAPSESLAEADGFAFKVKGTYKAGSLIKRLEKLELLLSDEESDFEINLVVKEVI